MSYVLAEKGGKQAGAGCKAWVDVTIGCDGGCIGCYAAKTSMMGSKFETHIKVKEYDSEKFIRSCKNIMEKGITFARFGKHSSGIGDLCPGTTSRILKDAQSTGLRLICVTKSLHYDGDLIKAFKEGRHILHISAGMLSKINSTSRRLQLFRMFKKAGVDTKLRIIEDITSEMPMWYHGFNKDDVLITPMRFPSKKDAAIYNVDLNKYKFIKGFYRPIVQHNSWNGYQNICGSINDKDYCGNCLI